MADSEKEIQQQLNKRGIKKDKDVVELYLANRNLKSVAELKRFKHLQRIWLNGNKLRRIDCFSVNLRLTELYLQDNMLTELNGALKHLRCLQVLMLHGNQLARLTDIVHEMRAMQELKVLNLFGNPLAQDYDYRSYIIYYLSSVELLDRQEVREDEREGARRKYEKERECIKDTIAFGRRVQGPPPKVFSPPPSRIMESLKAGLASGISDKSITFVATDESQEKELDEAIKRRGTQRSIMQYSTFDWSNIPLSEDKRLAEQPLEPPRIVTVRFR